MNTAATIALELKDLRKSFGRTEIIRGVNLAVAAGERVAIIGPNGAGKSTLFNLISGRFEPTSGEVLLDAVVAACSHGFCWLCMERRRRGLRGSRGSLCPTCVDEEDSLPQTGTWRMT